LAAGNAGLRKSPRLPEPDERRALRTVMELMTISRTSGHGEAVLKYLIKKLRAAGAPAASIRTDQAHKKTPLTGR